MLKTQSAWRRGFVAAGALASGLGLLLGSCASDGRGGGGLGRDGAGRGAESSPSGDREGRGEARSTWVRPPAVEPASMFEPLSLPAPTLTRLATGAPGPEYWQQRADYVINAVLDTERGLIRGWVRLDYTNNSPDQLGEMCFQLEQNLFRKGSKGDERFGRGKRFANRDGFDGGYTIETVMVGGQPASMTVDDTIGRVGLPVPIAGRGGKVSVTITYSFPVPMYGSDRMGIEESKAGRVYEIAQWYPSVCMYDDVSGWNTLGYLGQGEFYSNYGDYDVTLNVPSTHVVAATGELVNAVEVLTSKQLSRMSHAMGSASTVMIVTPEEVGKAGERPEGQNGRLSWRFEAKDVRTFAWASSDAFVWDGASALSGSEFGSGARGVLVQSMYPAEAAEFWSPSGKGGGSTAQLRFAIEQYSRTWRAYPYPTATNVSGVVGGMEYPMIIFCSGRGDERGLFGVTSHEIGHTWFPMMVNSDERRHAWMDEGFNTFINQFAFDERYPGAESTLTRRGNPYGFSRERPEGFSQPIMTPADDIEPSTLGGLQYGKPASGLNVLRNVVLGPERFDRAFRSYIQRWSFKSPQPADFFRTMEAESGEDLGWFWRGWFMSTEVMDQGVVRVTDSDAGPSGRRHVIEVESPGGLAMPVLLKLTREGGSEEVRSWPASIWRGTSGRRATLEFSDTLGAIKSVVIDPEDQLFDVDRSNNVWPR